MDFALPEIEAVEGRYAIARIAPERALPEWAQQLVSLNHTAGFITISRSERELSIVAPRDAIPPSIECERDFRVMRVKGTLDFGLVGLLAELTGRLARIGVPVFVVSTFDTDYLIVKDSDFESVIETLRR